MGQLATGAITGLEDIVVTSGTRNRRRDVRRVNSDAVSSVSYVLSIL
jgi:hypothetical protein